VHCLVLKSLINTTTSCVNVVEVMLVPLAQWVSHFNCCDKHEVTIRALLTLKNNENPLPVVRKQAAWSRGDAGKYLNMHQPVRTYASTLVSKENPAKRRLQKRIRRKHVQTCSCTHSVAKVLTSYRRRQNGHCS
jgi:hypothetical protein